MIDLSFLTEGEQETIRAVLRRDAELKKVEEQRVQNLQKTVSDKCQLKYLTGEWFYVTKQLRHQDRIHGSDIIRASMRHGLMPLTLLELAQIVPEKSSFVCSDNKEVFVPPILSGLLQEPELHRGTVRYENEPSFESLHDAAKPVLLSPTKRKNPFNNEVPVGEKDCQSFDGVLDPNQAAPERISPSSECCIYNAADLKEDVPESLVPQNMLAFSPENTAINSNSKDCCDETEESGDTQTASVAQRGILKNLSISSSTDPLLCHPIPQSPLIRELRPEPCVERKQVRFGSVRQDGVELESSGLLNTNTTGSTKALDTSEYEETDSTTAFTHGSSPSQSQTDSQERELECHKHQEKQNAKENSISDVSQHCDLERTSLAEGSFVCEEVESGLHGNLTQEKTDDEGKNECENKEAVGTHNLLKDPADIHPGDFRGIEEETQVQKVAEVRTLHLTALLNMPFKDTVSLTDAGSQREETERTAASFPQGLQAFWERENGCPRNGTGQEERHKDMPEKKTQASHVPQTDSDTTNANNSLSSQKTHTEEITVGGSSSTNGGFLGNLWKENGTYRANPVLVCEDTDDSTADPSEIQSQENIVSQVEHPHHSSATSQEEKSVKMIELKHFWEKENTGPTIITARFKETSSSTTDNVSFLQHSQRKPPDNKCEGEAQAPQTIEADFHKLPKVTSMGFVCQGKNRSQIWSTSDVPPGQVAAHPESQGRSRCPREEAPRSINHDDEIRRSPSKTCHPKVLPRESASATGSGLEGSPLKTFPIAIHPQTTTNEQEKLTPTHKRRSPEHVAAQATLAGQSTAVISQPEVLKTNGKTNDCNSSTSPQSKRSGTSTHPSPLLHKEDTSEESKAKHGPQSACRDSLRPSERTLSGVTSWIEKNRENISEREGTTRSWSLPRNSSGSYEESPCPMALKQSSMKSSRSSTKSLENLHSETVSSVPPSEQMKTRGSVPTLQQDGTDSDSTFETTLGCRRSTSSSMSNLSLSSGMASMSSVSGSMSSIYPSDFADIEVQGSIQFAVNYIQKLEEFHIFVVLCRGLAMADTKKNRSDPYVKCYLLPDKTKLGKRKSTVKKKTLNPTYNEILRFKILLEVLKTQNLNVSVWHNDTFGRNSFLGEVYLDLSEWDFSNTRINDYTLKPRVSGQTSPSHLTDSRGQMRVALRFLPRTSFSTRTARLVTGEVQIWVKDCKNLPPVRGITIDPFVKCAVLPDTSRKSRQKTRVVKRTTNPMFNHTMVYDGFRPEDLREACAEITVWDHDRLNNHYIGGLRLGLGTGKSYGVEVTWMDSTPEEANLWLRMLQANGEWVEDVISLRMLILAKKMSK